MLLMKITRTFSNSGPFIWTYNFYHSNYYLMKDLAPKGGTATGWADFTLDRFKFQIKLRFSDLISANPIGFI